MADETHHRDVNHTFADMKSDDPNPFIEMHKENAVIAWRLNIAGEPAWSAGVTPAKGAAGDGLLSAGLKPCLVASARRKKDCNGNCPECVSAVSYKLPAPQ
jgi:hypothetical protein